MSRVFTRQEFYDLVWSKPMTHIAKEFALSDVALHKICKKHDIPNPPLGWWAKKAAGKAVKQTPLPRREPEGPIQAPRMKQQTSTVRSPTPTITPTRHPGKARRARPAAKHALRQPLSSSHKAGEKRDHHRRQTACPSRDAAQDHQPKAPLRVTPAGARQVPEIRLRDLCSPRCPRRAG